MVECIDTTAIPERRRMVFDGAGKQDFEQSLPPFLSLSQGPICQSRWQVFRPPHPPRGGT
ncbi:hypothetical protein RISK_006461 [Rhodopirellula islandica]|uniref:Uncharacterized protein n=1 Tax=Rhodopirellula islandica TaxID=595434 RepID=A0A0J1B321_RHOIS|nr:hypothetical protein RISK_006461 [Rhodopirellula islandica]